MHIIVVNLSDKFLDFLFIQFLNIFAKNMYKREVKIKNSPIYKSWFFKVESSIFIKGIFYRISPTRARSQIVILITKVSFIDVSCDF